MEFTKHLFIGTLRSIYMMLMLRLSGLHTFEHGPPGISQLYYLCLGCIFNFTHLGFRIRKNGVAHKPEMC